MQHFPLQNEVGWIVKIPAFTAAGCLLRTLLTACMYGVSIRVVKGTLEFVLLVLFPPCHSARMLPKLRAQLSTIEAILSTSEGPTVPALAS